MKTDFTNGENRISKKTARALSYTGGLFCHDLSEMRTIEKSSTQK
jgi:hypothetical protein